MKIDGLVHEAEACNLGCCTSYSTSPRHTVLLAPTITGLLALFRRVKMISMLPTKKLTPRKRCAYALVAHLMPYASLRTILLLTGPNLAVILAFILQVVACQDVLLTKQKIIFFSLQRRIWQNLMLWIEEQLLQCITYLQYAWSLPAAPLRQTLSEFTETRPFTKLYFIVAH